MIEDFIISKLNEKELNVYASFPIKKPQGPFTVIQRMEQGVKDHINTITLDFFSYGKKVYDADSQDDAIKDAVFDLLQFPCISRIELGGGGNSTDSSNDLFESDSIFNITYYKEETK